MKFLSILVLILLTNSTSSLAQISDLECDSLYDDWSSDIDQYPVINRQIPEIEGGIKSLYEKLIYPEEAINSGLEESAMVWLVVSDEGKAECIRFIKLEHEVFKPSILNALEKQKFIPVMIEQKPIASSLLIPFNFKLN